MLLFLYGVDSYRSHQMLLALKAKHIDASLGDTNLSHLACGTVSVDALTNALLAPPFLAQTRLVILDRLLAEGAKTVQEAVLNLIPRLPESTVAVVYEPGMPDRRTALWKTLSKQATVHEFKPLAGQALQAWMNEQLAPSQVTIASAAVQTLVARCGTDSWRLVTELGKLGMAAVARAQPIVSVALVAELVRDGQEAGDFALSNALASGDPLQLLATLRRLARDGEPPQLLLGQVAASLRTLALLRDAIDQGVTDQRSIAAHTGVNPFVVGKHLGLARLLSAERIAELTYTLSVVDLDSKRGKIDAEVGLEIFLMKAMLGRQFLISH